MAKERKENVRDRIGYGSSYRKGASHDLNGKEEIGAVLGGQVWMVTPDKKGQSANPCIWMQAGVVDFKNCNNFYDCTTCKYDLGMRKKAAQGKQMTWQDAMRRHSGLERTCRHSLTNRIAKRQCAYDYECSHCDFDQFFEDVWTTKTRNFPTEVHRVKGFEVPMGYYFHNGHAWARIESGGYLRVGMDDFALKLLGKADALDLPLMGKELDQDEPGWGLRRGNNAADVLSPVGGVIVEVNSSVREDSGLTNREPYGEGWLFVLRNPDLKKTMKNLMDDTTGLEWIGREVSKLEGMIEDVAGPLAADGGHLANDIFGNLPDLGWGNLTKTFLKT
jgi:glycine cleavage system H lipoate-binding protein